MIGVSKTAINLMELGPERGGTRMPQPYNVNKLASALEVSVSFLLGEEESAEDMPPLDAYLRRVFALDDEQIDFVSRAVTAVEAERRLAELQAKYTPSSPEEERSVAESDAPYSEDDSEPTDILPPAAAPHKLQPVDPWPPVDEGQAPD